MSNIKINQEYFKNLFIKSNYLKILFPLALPRDIVCTSNWLKLQSKRNISQFLCGKCQHFISFEYSQDAWTKLMKFYHAFPQPYDFNNKNIVYFCAMQANLTIKRAASPWTTCFMAIRPNLKDNLHLLPFWRVKQYNWRQYFPLMNRIWKFRVVNPELNIYYRTQNPEMPNVNRLKRSQSDAPGDEPLVIRRRTNPTHQASGLP